MPTLPGPSETEPQLSPEEAKLITTLERLKGRALDRGEILLSLDQARAIGEP